MLCIGLMSAYNVIVQGLYMDRYALPENEADVFISLPKLMMVVTLLILGFFFNGCGM